MTKNKRVGIFGGTFNPLHMGHINSMITVAGQLDLDEIRVVPASQSPLRMPVEGPSPEQRLEMVAEGIKDYSDLMVVDDTEIRRGGISYTVDTLNDIKQRLPEADLFLIIGADQFEKFDHWKDSSRILEMTNLVVTSRPGAELPLYKEDFPPGIRDLVAGFDGQTALLTHGTEIHFLQLEDVAVSATEIRKSIRTQSNLEGKIPPRVAEYIRDKQLYAGFGDKIGDFEKFTRFCADLLFERKGMGVMGFDVRNITQPSEYTLIASGTSTRHTMSLAEHLTKKVKQEYGVLPQSVEGQKEGRWIVIDYGSLIIHVFYDFTRQEYHLEDLWKAGTSLELQDPFAGSQRQESV